MELELIIVLLDDPALTTVAPRIRETYGSQRRTKTRQPKTHRSMGMPLHVPNGAASLTQGFSPWSVKTQI